MRDYRRALDLCLTYLHALRDGDLSQDGGAAGRDREYFDVALRACMQLKDYETGRSLASQSRHLWKPYYAVGLSAANLYLSSKQPRGLSLFILFDGVVTMPIVLLLKMLYQPCWPVYR